MLYFVSLESRWRRKERIRYWVLEMSVWRMESLRFRDGFVEGLLLLFEVEVDVRSEPEAASSSIISI